MDHRTEPSRCAAGSAVASSPQKRMSTFTPARVFRHSCASSAVVDGTEEKVIGGHKESSLIPIANRCNVRTSFRWQERVFPSSTSWSLVRPALQDDGRVALNFLLPPKLKNKSARTHKTTTGRFPHSRWPSSSPRCFNDLVMLSPASVCVGLRYALSRMRNLMLRLRTTVWQSLKIIAENSALFLALALVVCLTSGCSDNSSNAIFATKTTGEPVIQAATNAVKVIGYHVGEKTDSETARQGLRAIDAEKTGGLVSALGPATVRIHIVVKSLEKESEIQVDIIPPRGAYGSTSLILHDYQFALSQILPDLSVKSRKVPREWF